MCDVLEKLVVIVKVMYVDVFPYIEKIMNRSK